MQLDKWLGLWREAVEGEFGAQRVYFMGIQGSRARGEAREQSDIDVVLILDALTADDAERYRKCVAALPERGKLCGFVSGRRELERWLPEELFSFCLDTLPVYGSLDELAGRVGAQDVRRAALGSVCGIYHACVHNLIHARSADALAELYKSAFFALRAIHCVETGERLRTRAELLSRRPEAERDLIESRPDGDFGSASARLLAWASEQITALGGGA